MKTNIKEICVKWLPQLVKGSILEIEVKKKDNSEHTYQAYIRYFEEIDAYYLSFSRHDDIFFFALEIDMRAFSNYILGYDLGGVWPNCKTIQDLCILLTALECFNEW